MNIRKIVYEFNTKYEQGFTNSEIDILLKEFPQINMEKFNDALMGNTCRVIDNEMVIYHYDVEKALLCGIENRNLNYFEFD